MARGKKMLPNKTSAPKVQALILRVKKAQGWTWETFAEKLRAAGVACTSKSLFRWGKGFIPHPNNAVILHEHLSKFRV